MRKIFILNGPNLNLLGDRRPEVYGTSTLGEIEKSCLEKAGEEGLEAEFRQTNHEGVLVDWVQEARRQASGLVINPGALTHYSYALRDAVESFDGPCVEVHLSNLFARESWRRRSVISDVVNGVIAGLGPRGYILAVEAMASLLREV